MPKHGKNFRKAVQECDTQERYSVEEAVEKSLGASFAKFDESVDIALRLGVDPKYSDQMVRGAVTLPNGLGKTVRVAVFAKGEKQAEARAAGADIVGDDDLVEQIKNGCLILMPRLPRQMSWLLSARLAVCLVPAVLCRMPRQAQ